MTSDQLETSEVPPVKEVFKGRRKNVIGYRVPMTTEKEQDIWRKFQERVEKDKWSELRYILIPKHLMELDLGEPIVQYLARFAVVAYNTICVKAGVSEGIHMTKILEFKYVPVNDSIYANYIIVEAIDNGLKCVCEALVQTLSSDGRKTLVDFHPADGWKQYEVSGMKKSFVTITPAEKEREEALYATINNSVPFPNKRQAGVFESELKSSRELADWNELREKRTSALKEPPSRSGLHIDNTIGNYEYFIPLKEFKNIGY